MKQTTKTENVAYFAPDAQAIITMANFMDMLIVHINMNKSIQGAKNEGYQPCDIVVPQFKQDMHNVNDFDEKRVYDLLTEMGFVPTGNVDFMPKGYEYHPRIVGDQWEEECDKPDAGDNLPESEEAMEQAKIASATMVDYVTTQQPVNEEHADYSVELRAINVPTENIKALAKRLARIFPEVEGNSTYHEIKKGLCNSSENNPYIITGLFFDTVFAIEKTVMDFNMVNVIPVFINVKDKDGNEITTLSQA